MTSGGRSQILYVVEGLVLVGVVPFLAMYMAISAVLVMASMVVLNIVIGLAATPDTEVYSQRLAQARQSLQFHDQNRGEETKYYHVTPLARSVDTSSR